VSAETDAFEQGSAWADAARSGACPDTARATVTWRFRLPKREIGYVRFIVEAYEGLAQVTSEPGRGEMIWIVPLDHEAQARQLASSLGVEAGLRWLD
jgi:hypothetical protein